MNRKALLVLFMVGLSLVTAASTTTRSSQAIQSTAKPASTPPAVAIPFELVNRHVMMQVKVNNSRPLSFVLDTGDKFAIIDLNRAKELSLKLEGEFRAGGAGSERPTGSFVKDATFTIP